MLASPFENKKTEESNRDFENAKVVFVSDLHRSDYAGGAELSTDALTKTSPFGEVCFLRSRELNKNHRLQINSHGLGNILGVSDAMQKI